MIKPKNNNHNNKYIKLHFYTWTEETAKTHTFIPNKEHKERKKEREKAAKPTVCLLYELTCLALQKQAAWSCTTVMESQPELWTTMACITCPMV